MRLELIIYPPRVLTSLKAAIIFCFAFSNTPRLSSMRYWSTTKTVKVVSKANNTAITVTIPKLLVIMKVDDINASKRELRNLNVELSGSSPMWCVRSEWGIKNRITGFLANADTGKLTVFSMNPNFIKEYKSDPRKRKATIIVDDISNFDDFGLEFRLMKEHYVKQLREKTFEGMRFSLDCMMINAGRETLIVSSIGGDNLAIIIKKMPMISTLQEIFLELSV